MAVDSTPVAWLGLGYSLSSAVISVPIAGHAGTTVGTFTADAPSDVLTASVAHRLTVGDRVRFTTTTTLPAGLAAATDYYVLTTPAPTTLTLSATLGGAVLDITDAGTGTHTMLAQGVIAEVSAAEANATSGDMRKILWGLCERLYIYWNALTASDRPAKMTLRKATRIDAATNQVTATYYFEFVLTPGSFEVTSE